MYFQNHGLQKTCLNKFLKNTIRKDTSASGMVNGKKHCGNLDDTTLSVVIDHCEGRWVKRNLSY